MLSVIHAALLGTLLFVPLAVLLRRPSRLVCVSSEGFDTGKTVPRRYAVILAATSAAFVVGVLLRGLSLQHNIETLTLLGLITACLWKAPVHTLAGPLAYCLLSYTFDRGDTVTRTLMDMHGTTWAAAMAMAAATVHAGGRLPIHRNALVWCVGLFSAWLAVSTVVALSLGFGPTPDLIHRATRYVEVVALFFVAASARPALETVRTGLLVLGIVLVMRQTLFTSNWLFDQNLAMVAVITAPVALALAFTRPLGRAQFLLGASALYLTAMVLFVQNRGAMVGLAVAGLALWPLARRRWLGLLVLVCLVPLVGYGAWQAGLLDRFQEISSNGRFIGSAAQRIEIWTAGSQTFREHPLVGVGPGHFVMANTRSTEGRVWRDAHSSPVELIVEVGVPGLLLYAGVLVTAVVVLARVARRHRHAWPRTAAAGLLGSLGAHVGAGLFFTNPSLALTWTLLGIAAGLDRPEGPAGSSTVISGEPFRLTEPESKPSR